jgi:hypothetical protein
LRTILALHRTDPVGRRHAAQGCVVFDRRVSARTDTGQARAAGKYGEREVGRTYRAIIACCIPLVLAACAAARTDALESQSKQKDARLARLYFIRPGGWMAQGGTIGIKVNGQNVGGIAHGSYLFVDRPFGTYTLTVVPPFDWGNFETDVRVAAGTTYYYAIAVKPTAVPLAGGGVVTLSQSNPGTPTQNKSGNIFTTFRLNALDAATGAAAIANLRAQ